MAASNNPMLNDFHFHNIRTFTFRALILSTPENTAGSLEIGGLLEHPRDFRIQATFDGGRLGTPGLELRFEHIPSGKFAQIVFEPGVNAGSNFNLQSFSSEWLGRPGGGGHLYDKDPVSVGDTELPVKKRTVKVRVQAHGHISPDPSAVGALVNILPQNSPVRRFIRRLTAWNDVGTSFWLYCVIPDQSIGAFQARTLAPLNLAVRYRVPPYHQLSHPQNVLNLDMERLPGFRNHMYCNIIPTGPHVRYTAAQLVLADTRGRRAPRHVADVHAAGVIRELQDYDTFCTDIMGNYQSMKLVKASHPVLDRATRAFGGNTSNPPVALPIHQSPCFGCIDRVMFGGQHRILLPRAGEIFAISWGIEQTGGQWIAMEKAYGVVLRLSTSDLAEAGTGLVLGLWTWDPSIHQRATTSLANAIAETVRFDWIPNHKIAQTELEALKLFHTRSVAPMVISLQVETLFQPMGARNVPQSRKDLRLGPNPPRNNAVELANRTSYYNGAVQDLCSLPQLANMTQTEINLLRQVPGRIDGLFQLLQTSPAQHHFRSVLALALLLSSAGGSRDTTKKGTHQVILVVEDPGDSSGICHDLYALLQSAKTSGRNDGELWNSKKMIAYSTLEIEHEFTPQPPNENAIRSQSIANPAHPLREWAELAFEYLLSDFPEHHFLMDQTGHHWNQSFANPPAGCTPLGMSMGDANMITYLHNAAGRDQYYADRAAVIDNSALSTEKVHDVRAKRHAAVQRVLRDVDILVTNAATAASVDVKASFSNPIIILINAQHRTFAQALSVLMAFPKLEAGFVVGVDRVTPQNGMFASLGHNEAQHSFFRSFWTMLRNNGASCFTL